MNQLQCSARFEVITKKDILNGADAIISTEIELSAVQPETPYDKTFWEATPIGNLN